VQEESIEKAEKDLKKARQERELQERKRVQEKESVSMRIARLAGNDSNHLGLMMLEALTEKFHGKAGDE
jgi:hypothetical protein